MIPITYCIAEDRKSEEVALRIVIACFRQYEPDSRLIVFCPNVTEEFIQWTSFYKNTEVRSYFPKNSESWHCKPYILSEILEEGAEFAVWLDNDLLVNRSLSEFFTNIPKSHVVVAQEQSSANNQGSLERTKNLGLNIGREIPITTNTCVIRVGQEHLHLLHRWQEVMESSVYKNYQELQLHQRPFWAIGDQDVICGLLGSKEFQHIPIHLLRDGVDVIHCGGGLSYSSMKRLRGLLIPIPTFFHSSGLKPWRTFGNSYYTRQTGWDWVYKRLTQEVSPYFQRVKHYREYIGTDCYWMEYRTLYGTIICWLSFGNHALCGLPVTLVAEMGAQLLSLIKRRKISNVPRWEEIVASLAPIEKPNQVI